MIVGKRVYLRAVEEKDLIKIVDWRNDPSVYKFFYEQEPLSLETQRIWFKNFLNRSDEKLWIIDSIETREQPIGTVGLVHLDWRNRKGEWGRFLIGNTNFRNGGYGSEVEALILRYYFDHLNMNRLQCEVFLDNENVWKLHEKFGFKREGLFRQYVFKEGKYKDVVYLSMLREEYLLKETQDVINKYLV